MKIDSFQGKNRFLSNFWRVPIEYDGDLYPSVEHAYQAAKTDNFQDRLRIRLMPTAGDAKRAGRRVEIRSDWEQVKLDVMYQLVKQKFSAEPLRSQLIATGDNELIEGNTWNDTFWGICRGRGENHLGKILMRVRGEF